MFDDVEADNGVELEVLGIGGYRGGIGAADPPVGACLAQFFEVIEIQGVDVTRPINLAWSEVQGHIADARTEFEDLRTDVRVDAVGHPARKFWGTVEASEDFTAVLVGGVNLV